MQPKTLGTSQTMAPHIQLPYQSEVSPGLGNNEPIIPPAYMKRKPLYPHLPAGPGRSGQIFHPIPTMV